MTTIESSRDMRPEYPETHLWKATEDSDIDSVMEARKVHASAYVRAGHLKPSDVGSDGLLDGTLDSANGPDVTYYIASNVPREDLLTGRVRAEITTGRIVEVGTSRDVDDLRAWRWGRRTLSDAQCALVQSHQCAYGKQGIAELSSFAKTSGSPSVWSLDIVREMLIDSLRRPVPMLWLAAIVPDFVRTLRATFGGYVMRDFGAPIKLAEEYPGSDIRVELTPVVVEATRFLPNMLNFGLDCPNRREGAMVLEHLNYLLAGIPAELLPEDFGRVASDCGIAIGPPS